MDIPSLLAKVAGVLLLIWTGFSVQKHVRLKYFEKSAVVTAATQSVSETFLNNLLLYLWHAFMLAFSIGMIVNN